MLYSALLLGLLSSLHCIGMCGPIAMMLPLDRNNAAKKVIQLFTYHAGRITAYASLGLVFGVLGKGLYLAGIQQQLSITAGIIMILIVMIPEKVFAMYNFSKPIYILIARVKTSLGSQFKKKSGKALFMTGLFNGYLPCGLVYAALFGAIAMQGEVKGTLYMVFYGLGTIPLMSAVVYGAGVLKTPARRIMAGVVPYAAVFVGMLFIVRGLGLSIPYLSPGAMSLFVGTAPNCR